MSTPTMMLIVVLALIPIVTCSVQVPRARALMFRAVPGGIPTTTIGELELTERNGMVTITGTLTGLPQGLHGFHVHEFGDLSNGCLASGVHFNPFRSDHGGLADPPSNRHVGDLGNIMTPFNGATAINIEDSLMTFTGNRGIIGRAFVVHANPDDLGTVGDIGSRTVGNSGARIACGIIGYISTRNG